MSCSGVLVDLYVAMVMGPVGRRRLYFDIHTQNLCTFLPQHSNGYLHLPTFPHLAPACGRVGAASTLITPAHASDSSVEDLYFPEDDVEDLEQYRAGGYHPTLIGDSFQKGRYTVLHKLGYGGYSTIWLARDHQQHRYVSLKIKVSETSSPSRETQIMCLLGNRDAQGEGRRFVPNLLDESSIAGPNGIHSCLVGEAAGLNVSASKEMSSNWKFPV